jgi:hypothetical protein
LSRINLDNAEFVYEPFPMGLARPVFEPDLYERLVAAFPGPDQLARRPEQGRKYGLSDQVVNAREFRRFVGAHELWREVWEEVRSREFRVRLLELLRDAGIDLSLLPSSDGLRERVRRGRDAVRRRYVPPRRPRLRGTLEFSMMPADGGHILPHTDVPEKLVTLVFSMVAPGEWRFVNQYLEFDEVEVLKTFPFEPNQAVIFVKTFNSLHCVRPMTGPENAMRRTLTANLRRIY